MDAVWKAGRSRALLNGRGPSGSHQPSRQDFNKLSGLQLEMSSSFTGPTHPNLQLLGSNQVVLPPVGRVWYCPFLM